MQKDFQRLRVKQKEMQKGKQKGILTQKGFEMEKQRETLMDSH